MGYSPWSCKELDMTEVSEHSTLTHTQNRQVENSLQSSILRSRQGEKCRTNTKGQAFKTFCPVIAIEINKIQFSK